MQPTTPNPTTHGTQLFNVPNTKAGRLFIKLAKRYASKQINLRPMPRCANRVAVAKAIGYTPSPQNYNCQSNIPMAGAQWFALYGYSTYGTHTQRLYGHTNLVMGTQQHLATITG